MIDHIIDIAEEGVSLSIRYDNLIIKSDEKEQHLPLAEIAVLVTAHPRISYTHSVLSGLAKAGSVLVVCDDKKLPCSMQIPLDNNYLQTERFAKQSTISLPMKKRLWQQVVRAKIRSQSALLIELYGDDFGISNLLPEIKSGDPKNVEAQAARIYWKKIFNDDKFIRNRCGEDQNRFLNYGYAVLRAIIARAVCAAGLHPSIGLHHHNRYNSFCLVDDLMEPYRVIIDRAVVEIINNFETTAPMDQDIKMIIFDSLRNGRRINGEMRSVFDCAFRTASSLNAAFICEAQFLAFPEF